jgi:hypothetical protein
MLSVISLSVVMPSVVAPLCESLFEGKFDLACITNKRGGLGGWVGGWFNFMTAQTKIKVSKTEKEFIFSKQT